MIIIEFNFSINLYIIVIQFVFDNCLLLNKLYAYIIINIIMRFNYIYILYIFNKIFYIIIKLLYFYFYFDMEIIQLILTIDIYHHKDYNINQL